MKREAQINTIVDFLLDKNNKMVKTSSSKDGKEFQHISIDCEAEGVLNSEPGIISLKAHQRTLFSMIAVAMIENPKNATFKGMAGRFSMKRLQEGITFGFSGYAYENLYPKGEFYEYRLHAWVK